MAAKVSDSQYYFVTAIGEETSLSCLPPAQLIPRIVDTFRQHLLA